MKYELIYLAFILLICQSAGAQSSSRTHYNFTIFSKEQAKDFLIGSDQKFTPDLNLVKTVEERLKGQIKQINDPAVNQGIDNCPYIHKKFSKYRRQYVGYINENGERILFINAFYHKRKSYQSWRSEMIQVSDGCSFYWSVEYNIDQDKFYNYWVNGVA